MACAYDCPPEPPPMEIDDVVLESPMPANDGHALSSFEHERVSDSWLARFAAAVALGSALGF